MAKPSVIRSGYKPLALGVMLGASLFLADETIAQDSAQPKPMYECEELARSPDKSLDEIVDCLRDMDFRTDKWNNRYLQYPQETMDEGPVYCRDAALAGCHVLSEAGYEAMILTTEFLLDDKPVLHSVTVYKDPETGLWHYINHPIVSHGYDDFSDMERALVREYNGFSMGFYSFANEKEYIMYTDLAHWPLVDDRLYKTYHEIYHSPFEWP